MFALIQRSVIDPRRLGWLSPGGGYKCFPFAWISIFAQMLQQLKGIDFQKEDVFIFFFLGAFPIREGFDELNVSQSLPP